MLSLRATDARTIVNAMPHGKAQRFVVGVRGVQRAGHDILSRTIYYTTLVAPEASTVTVELVPRLVGASLASLDRAASARHCAESAQV